MFYTPNVARQFDSVSDVLDWATGAYKMSTGNVSIRWTKVTTFTNGNGGETTIWNVLISDDIYSEWFVLMETETPLSS